MVGNALLQRPLPRRVLLPEDVSALRFDLAHLRVHLRLRLLLEQHRATASDVAAAGRQQLDLQPLLCSQVCAALLGIPHSAELVTHAPIQHVLVGVDRLLDRLQAIQCGSQLLGPQVVFLLVFKGANRIGPHQRLLVGVVGHGSRLLCVE